MAKQCNFVNVRSFNKYEHYRFNLEVDHMILKTPKNLPIPSF